MEHALDEILSQGASEEDNDDDMGLGRPAAEATMSDSEVEEAEAIAQEEREDGMIDYKIRDCSYINELSKTVWWKAFLC